MARPKKFEFLPPQIRSLGSTIEIIEVRYRKHFWPIELKALFL